MSPATVNRHLAALSSAFRVAIEEWGWLKENPVKHVKKLKEASGRIRFLSDDEDTVYLKHVNYQIIPIFMM